jgi:hypothetical protein
VAGGWRRLHNEELHDFYTTPNTIRVIKSRKMRLAGYVACMEEMSNVYKILVAKPERKGPFGRPRGRREVDTQGLEIIMHLAQDMDKWRAPVNTAMNLRVP